MVVLEKAQQGFNFIMNVFGILNIVMTICIVVEIIPYRDESNKIDGLVLFCAKSLVNQLSVQCLIPIDTNYL